jgi:hypothetical protein
MPRNHFKKCNKEIPSFSRDLLFGKRSEDRFEVFMEKQLGLKLKKTPPHCFYDFTFGENVLIELKTRRVNRKRYPSTIVGYDKIQRFEKLNEANNGCFRFFLVFHFKDSIYFKEHLPNYQYSVSNWVRKKRIGYDDKSKDYAFIPTDDLLPIEKLPAMIANEKKIENRIKVINNLVL